MTQFKKGQQPWNKGKKGYITSGSFKNGHGWLGGGVKKGYIPWNKGLTKTDKRVKNNCEKAAITKKKFGLLRKENNPFYGKKHTQETKLKLSEKRKKLWQNEEYVKKFISKSYFRPTKPEILIQKLLQEWYPNEWQYTGNGSFWVGFPPKNPDFVNINGKKLFIEFDGKYWHQNIDKTEEREKHFLKYGFKTLFLNEDDLIDFNQLKQKLGVFVNGY